LFPFLSFITAEREIMPRNLTEEEPRLVWVVEQRFVMHGEMLFENDPEEG